MTPQERDARLRLMVGQTWDEIAEEHDMRCGACRGGMLELDAIDVTLEMQAFRWTPELVTAWRPYTIAPRKSVTLTLKCDTCGMAMQMSIHAKES